MKTIGISISESPELEALGFSTEHLDDAMVEIGRYLLARGDRLAYGGDLRPEGFTTSLAQLTRVHRSSANIGAGERLLNYLAWPIWAEQAEMNSALTGMAKVLELPSPEDLGVIDASAPMGRSSPEDRYKRARSLTAMREQMTRDIDARIALGGKTAFYSGLLPGIVEEVYLAMLAEKPVYIMGAFGGGARAVVEALRGGRPEALSKSYREALEEKGTPFRKAALFAAYHDHGRSEPALDAVAFFNEKGWLGLRNGLDALENEALAETDDVLEMIGLILEGLRRLGL